MIQPLNLKFLRKPNTVTLFISSWDSQQSYNQLFLMVRLVNHIMWLLNMKNSCYRPLEIKINFSNTYMNVKKTAYFMTCCSTTGQMIFNKLLIVSIEFSFNILIRYIKKVLYITSLKSTDSSYLKCLRAQSPTITSDLSFWTHTCRETHCSRRQVWQTALINITVTVNSKTRKNYYCSLKDYYFACKLICICKIRDILFDES